MDVRTDEEIGGDEGMGSFVKSEDFKRMNVGFMIDESCASPKDFIVLFNVERSCWGESFSICDETSIELSKILLVY